MKRLEKLQKFKKKTEIFFTATHFLFSGWIYVLSGSTIAQLFIIIIMYILFLVFSNFTRRDPKKLYINL